MQDLFSGIGLV